MSETNGIQIAKHSRDVWDNVFCEFTTQLNYDIEVLEWQKYNKQTKAQKS